MKEIVERSETLSSWEVMKEQAALVVKSGLAPKSIDTAEKALVIMLTGRELRIPPMAALRRINVINGAPAISSELMLAMCLERIRGFRYKVVKETEDCCEFWAARPVDGGLIEYTARFTVEDAARAGLLNKQNWQLYRAAMLRARAISAALRVVAPDVLMGLYTPDELGAVTDGNEEVVSEVELDSAPVDDEPRVEADAGAEEGAEEGVEYEEYEESVHFCADCGVEITEHSSGGRTYSVAEIVESSMTRFGRPLCVACGKQAKKSYQGQLRAEW